MHRMMSIAALEYVGTGLGYRFDGLNESKPNEYNDAAKALKYFTDFMPLLDPLILVQPPYIQTLYLPCFPALLGSTRPCLVPQEIGRLGSLA